jgi:hypothetical protein
VVVSAANRAFAGALIVPDEQTWTVSGRDPAAHGLRPVFGLGRVQRLLVPGVLPAALEGALRSCLAELPADVEIASWVLPGFDHSPGRVAEQGEHAVHGGHEMHRAAHDALGDDHEMDEDHGMHGAGHHAHGDEHSGHGDMMAIVGESSADGLVMEPIELRFGPLGTPLPGGLEAEVTLDGDVVAESTVHALLSAGPPAAPIPSPPDLLAPIAWGLAIEAAVDNGVGASAWPRLAALELERAVSHLAWLRALGRLLGWPLLVDRCTRAVEGLPPLAHRLAAERTPTAMATRCRRWGESRRTSTAWLRSSCEVACYACAPPGSAC